VQKLPGDGFAPQAVAPVKCLTACPRRRLVSLPRGNVNPGRDLGVRGVADAAYASVVERPSTTALSSSHVVERPRLKRTAPVPTSGGTRIASSTGDSVTRSA